MNITLQRTNSDNPDFRILVASLEVYLTAVDEAAHEVCKPHNNLETIAHVITAYVD